MDKQRFEIVVGVEVEIRPEGAKLEEHEKQLRAVAMAARIGALREAAGISVSFEHCATAEERVAVAHVVDQYAFKIDRLILDAKTPVENPAKFVAGAETEVDERRRPIERAPIVSRIAEAGTVEVARCSYSRAEGGEVYVPCPNAVEHLVREKGMIVGFACHSHGEDLQKHGARYVPAAARSSPGIVQPRVSS